MRATHARTCNVCEAMCGMLVTVEDGKITDVRGDPDDPLSRGHICPKGPAMREIQEDPDRLRYPVRRTASGAFERIGWPEALDETATRLRELQQRHGRDSVGFYLGNPTVHNHGAIILAQAFARALGSKNRFDANSMDANPRLFASLCMLGDPTAIPVPDVDRTDYLLMLGANPAASNGSLMSLGDVRGRMKGIRERGGRVVILDPRRTESAAWADEHVFIRPGGDAAFLLGLLHTLFAENLIDEVGTARIAAGLGELRRLAGRFSPDRVAAAAGVPADTIRRLAREFARARGVCYGRVGTTVNEFGCSAAWLIDAVNVVCGRFDVPGGAMFTTPAIDLGRLARSFGVNRYGRWRSRVRGLPELAGQLPCAVMAEEMETPGPGQIKGFVTLAGNPVSSAPNAQRLDRAFAGLEFMVAIDFYVNETSRHAHIILPPRYALERAHMDVVLQAFAVRNVAKWSPPVVPPAPDTMEDWEILYELGMRLGGLRLGLGPLERLLRLGWRAGLRVSPERIIDLGIRIGPQRGLTLAKVKAAPHGLDLGPLEPRLAKVIRTPSRKVELAPKLLVDDLPRLEAWIDANSRQNGLVLIGRRQLRTNNSWMHNCPSLVKGPDRSGLLMHPEDAGRLGLAEGATVTVKSRVGRVEAKLETTDTIMPGVVSLPHGFGHQKASATMRVAGALPGANVNDLTDDERVEPVCGTALLNGVPVTVEATGT